MYILVYIPNITINLLRPANYHIIVIMLRSASFLALILHAMLDFLINQSQFTAAVTEECTSVDADFDPSLDDDLEADLYQECQSCSLATGPGGSQSKREELMIINQCSSKYTMSLF